MAYDPQDDVDRLFACFKCGVSTPESAIKEKRLSLERSKKASSRRGQASEGTTPSSSKQRQGDSLQKEKLGACMSEAAKLKSGKQISPIIFYGSPHGAPIKKPSRLLRLLHEIHFDLKEENDFVSRKQVWATFPRQEEAIRFLKGHSQVKLFSYQDHLSGQRRFLVSTYSEFWRRYKDMDPKLRHHYEVIQEGLPCHLYFDLEFDKRVNTNKNVDEMVDILMSITFNVLFEKYSIEGNEGWIIELDSSTTEKFSRHVIIRIPNIAFKDNSHVGAFVFEVCSRISSQRGSNSQLGKLYIAKDSTSPDLQLFLDSAVYTRNRCFRLAFSSKAGKNSFLLPTGRFKCKNMNEQEVFMESLICRMESDCNKLLICHMDTDCMRTLCFDSEVHQQNPDVPQYAALNAYRSDFPSTYTSGKSPFPALDAFVEYIASSGCVLGKIQSWCWFSAHGLIVYTMSRNRYCERIDREHKSNHVMYVADLHRATYYQKCHDPDCRGYRSPLRPLPNDVIPDSTSLTNSTQMVNCREELNTSFNLSLDGGCNEHYSYDDDAALVTANADGSKNENNWWQEAMTYADCIENMRNENEVGVWDGENGDDCTWWMDAEMLVSQIEEQLA
ncbi:DNA-directed primase/polymerase protein isoform X2 [Canna indica]|uniref:DNA-directed primase/polymerase protein n=1 Tax=Canna indica TaxID=4628 RepID=A0AAQ3QFA3_9LILI|nr:DNA-directed primase/polymerase protein isoform X2 [Canna indica]